MPLQLLDASQMMMMLKARITIDKGWYGNNSLYHTACLLKACQMSSMGIWQSYLNY